MPPKKSKRSKKQVGGWFWERDDPVFGASNRWIGDKVIKPVDNFLKESKLLSKIITPIGGFLGGPGGAIAGAAPDQIKRVMDVDQGVNILKLDVEPDILKYQLVF